MQKEPNLVRQVISADTSATVCTLLEKVVSEGSGKTARVPGYRIGGKTGTSEKLDQQGDDGVEDYVSSFLAVAPIDDPQIVVLMLLDEAQMENRLSCCGAGGRRNACGYSALSRNRARLHRRRA